jgi:hypothetical protein
MEIIDFYGRYEIADEFKEVQKTVKNGCRQYSVTIEPQILVYCGQSTTGVYTVIVYAIDSADSIKQVRKQRRDENGRHCVPAKYSAKLFK